MRCGSVFVLLALMTSACTGKVNLHAAAPVETKQAKLVSENPVVDKIISFTALNYEGRTFQQQDINQYIEDRYMDLSTKEYLSTVSKNVFDFEQKRQAYHLSKFTEALRGFSWNQYFEFHAIQCNAVIYEEQFKQLLATEIINGLRPFVRQTARSFSANDADKERKDQAVRVILQSTKPAAADSDWGIRNNESVMIPVYTYFGGFGRSINVDAEVFVKRLMEQLGKDMGSLAYRFVEFDDLARYSTGMQHLLPDAWSRKRMEKGPLDPRKYKPVQNPTGFRLAKVTSKVKLTDPAQLADDKKLQGEWDQWISFRLSDAPELASQLASQNKTQLLSTLLQQSNIEVREYGEGFALAIPVPHGIDYLSPQPLALDPIVLFVGDEAIIKQDPTEAKDAIRTRNMRMFSAWKRATERKVLENLRNQFSNQGKICLAKSVEPRVSDTLISMHDIKKEYEKINELYSQFVGEGGTSRASAFSKLASEQKFADLAEFIVAPEIEFQRVLVSMAPLYQFKQSGNEALFRNRLNLVRSLIEELNKDVFFKLLEKEIGFAVNWAAERTNESLRDSQQEQGLIHREKKTSVALMLFQLYGIALDLQNTDAQAELANKKAQITQELLELARGFVGDSVSEIISNKDLFWSFEHRNLSFDKLFARLVSQRTSSLTKQLSLTSPQDKVKESLLVFLSWRMSEQLKKRHTEWALEHANQLVDKWTNSEKISETIEVLRMKAPPDISKNSLSTDINTSLNPHLTSFDVIVSQEPLVVRPNSRDQEKVRLGFDNDELGGMHEIGRVMLEVADIRIQELGRGVGEKEWMNESTTGVEISIISNKRQASLKSLYDAQTRIQDKLKSRRFESALKRAVDRDLAPESMLLSIPTIDPNTKSMRIESIPTNETLDFLFSRGRFAEE